MQFACMTVSQRMLQKILKLMPEWYTGSDVRELARRLPTDGHAALAATATRISVELGRKWGHAAQLVHCTVSEERLVTINVPAGDEFYQIRFCPAGHDVLDLRLFYPQVAGSAMWFGKLSATMVYDLGMREDRVCLDGEWVSVGAWSAMCALLVAQGQESGGEVGILMDMAREGVI